MANITNIIIVRDSAVTTGDNRKTGLTPTWVSLKALSDNSNVTPQPTITEIGQGQYKFTYDAEALGEAAGQIDAGSGLANPSDRYIDVVLTRDSSRVQSGIDTDGKVLLRATQTGVTIPTVTSVGSVSGSVGSVSGAVGSVTNPVTVGTNNDKANYSLASGEYTNIANEVENQIINDTDSEKVLTAITNKIASVNPSLGDLTLAGIAARMRTELATELNYIVQLEARVTQARAALIDKLNVTGTLATTSELTDVQESLITEIQAIETGGGASGPSAEDIAQEIAQLEALQNLLLDGGTVVVTPELVTYKNGGGATVATRTKSTVGTTTTLGPVVRV